MDDLEEFILLQRQQIENEKAEQRKWHVQHKIGEKSEMIQENLDSEEIELKLVPKDLNITPVNTVQLIAEKEHDSSMPQNSPKTPSSKIDQVKVCPLKIRLYYFTFGNNP